MPRTGRATGWLLAALLVSTPGLRGAEPRAVDSGYSRQTAYATGDPALDGLQDFFRPTLEANRKELAGRSGALKAFGAGERYPQVWLRDSATLGPLVRYHYAAEYLTSWLEEHFANQAEDGGLYDWIAPGPPSAFREYAPEAREVFRTGPVVFSADKNTVEADQESSAVLSVCQAFRATGDHVWLRKPIAGVPLLDRADRALGFLLEKRLDARLGLVTSGFSADWGDVSPVHADQKAVYIDDRTPLVAGLYTNALFVQAARCLGDLHGSVGDTSAAGRWRDSAAAITAAANRHLWQPTRGFYRMHVPLGPTALPDDSSIFGTGGNAAAILSGIADDRRARRIFSAAEQGRRRFAVSTIAGTLLPPYPAGVFKHPAMREPWTYQNGGQWDWFGARLVLAAFQHGESDLARRWLGELARKAGSNGGLYEWHTREGEGRGSRTYAGSAGALAATVFEGLFGVTLSAETLNITVRLGPKPGRIHLYEPATDTFVAYRYDPTPKSLVIDYDGNHRRAGRVAVLIPHGRTVRAALMDGQPVAFKIEARGAERYAAVSTSWGRHRLEVRAVPVRFMAASAPRPRQGRRPSSGPRSTAADCRQPLCHRRAVRPSSDLRARRRRR